MKRYSIPNEFCILICIFVIKKRKLYSSYMTSISQLFLNLHKFQILVKLYHLIMNFLCIQFLIKDYSHGSRCVRLLFWWFDAFLLECCALPELFSVIKVEWGIFHEVLSEFRHTLSTFTFRAASKNACTSALFY